MLEAPCESISNDLFFYIVYEETRSLIAGSSIHIGC